MIKRMKYGRAIIMTTHAMDEADALSDRIGIISNGQLITIGNSLLLKNKYGEGYKLTITAKRRDDLEMMKLKLGQLIPSGKVVSQQDLTLLMTIPSCKIIELGQFFKIMEQREAEQEGVSLADRIDSWGLNYTTLEEVFMNISNLTR